MPLVKGGLVLVDFDTGSVIRIVPFQYNPETLSRTLQVQGVGAESGPHVDQMRLKGPPIETYKLDVEIDATDRLEHPDADPTVTSSGIAPQLAAFETIIYPTTVQLQAADSRTRAGTLEIAPMDAPLTLLVLSKNRIIPVKITEFSVTEDMFDAQLNPIRAKLSLGLRVLSIDDIGFATKGGSLYMTYQQRKERLAGSVTGALSTLGISALQ